jgi:hypothetical protein
VEACACCVLLADGSSPVNDGKRESDEKEHPARRPVIRTVALTTIERLILMVIAPLFPVQINKSPKRNKPCSVVTSVKSILQINALVEGINMPPFNLSSIT